MIFHGKLKNQVNPKEFGRELTQPTNFLAQHWRRIRTKGQNA
jgi:hypothetical protein